LPGFVESVQLSSFEAQQQHISYNIYYFVDKYQLGKKAVLGLNKEPVWPVKSTDFSFPEAVHDFQVQMLTCIMVKMEFHFLFYF
jgi:hypothetical protein